MGTKCLRAKYRAVGMRTKAVSMMSLRETKEASVRPIKAKESSRDEPMNEMRYW